MKKKERLSVFDIFKIGVGPSSSHTLGPWRAALHFVNRIEHYAFDRIQIDLYGSLSKTGRGHATDIAIILGLSGYDPEQIDTSKIDDIIHKIRAKERLALLQRSIPFDFSKDIVYNESSLEFHPNGMKLTIWNNFEIQHSETYFSTGGGFIICASESDDESKQHVLPFPIDNGEDLIQHTDMQGQSVSEIVWQNELAFRTRVEVVEGMEKIFRTMQEAVFRGCHSEGELPGGLGVKRRARLLSLKLLDGVKCDNFQNWISAIKNSRYTFSNVNKWVSCFALAVNEENAALGRIVTSPTNGAAGVIPAVLLYHHCFGENIQKDDTLKFLLTAGEIGCIFKKGATISAAEGGCQAEIGVSSAMAAGGLTEILGGSPRQVLMAAEIAMEHHLGLTCDPIGGLVQVPCIERNAMGAMKAITAAHLALSGEPVHAIVKFDTVVQTMWETAQDMNLKYKETAEGGLAIKIPVGLPNC
ncbi:MAG: L-serine ammonia-lyase [Bacteroidia bacterium]|nr:L-serine ammonia-lyase [Bacteroidia bacterium]